MCVSVKTVVVQGLRRKVICGKCWSCRDKRRDDLVGRVHAEARMADRSFFCTLTYSDDPSVTAKFSEQEPVLVGRRRYRRRDPVSPAFAASSIVKRHLVTWAKRLREAGVDYERDDQGRPIRGADGRRVRRYRWKVRTIQVGEFGTSKGRSHFHVIAFFYGEEAPPVVLDKRMWGGDMYWSHGMVQWERYNPSAAAYLCHYMLKTPKVDNKLLRNTVSDPRYVQMMQWGSRSTRPPLGIEYFRERGREHARQGIAPRSLEYFFEDLRHQQSGRPRKFKLEFGTPCADAFLQSFIDEWHKRNPDLPDTRMPLSDLLYDYLDSRAKVSSDLVQRRAMRVERPHVNPDGALVVPGVEPQFVFAENLNAWIAQDGAGRRLYWSWDDAGLPAWVPDLVAPSVAQARRKAAARTFGTADDYRMASQPSGRSRRGRRSSSTSKGVV